MTDNINLTMPDIHIGQEVIRDADDMPGKITRREGDRYIIAWQDNSTGFVLVSAMEAGHAEWRRNAKPPHGNVQQRAKEARLTLEAIRKGQDVNAALAAHRGKSGQKPSEELTAEDRAKILARLNAGGHKPAPSSNQGQTAKPAPAPSATDSEPFRKTVSGHFGAILCLRAKGLR